MTQTRKRTGRPTARPVLERGVAAGRERLRMLEDRAQGALAALTTRGHRELESLMARWPVEDLRARLPLEPWADRARSAGTDARRRVDGALLDLDRRLDLVRGRARHWLQAAGAEDVALLKRDVRSLSRKVGRLAKSAEKGAPAPAAAPGSGASGRKTRPHHDGAARRRRTVD